MAPTESSSPAKNAFRSWSYLLRERYLRLFKPVGSPFPLSRQLPEEERKHLRVRWPASRIGGEIHPWLVPVLGLRRLVHVEIVPIDQPKSSVALWELVHEGIQHTIAVDVYDRMEWTEPAAPEKSVVYFKMQFRKFGYADWAALSARSRSSVNISVEVYQAFRFAALGRRRFARAALFVQ